ncbi:MAG: hypothetical protein KDC56_10945, partial [Flavobacteriaceae bacterium]|nr:hypothetical protein [Flavobacteriaceae bacterium]
TGTLAEEGVMGYQPLNAARNDIKMFDPDGIGGFSITSENGTTYHYALPVYQFQKVDIIQNKANTSEDFIESSDLNMHAVNWLLTGITGPDFQDIGVNKGFIDDGDLGYWVKFNYGKWSDGFLWRTPHGNMEFEEYRDLGVVQYSFGLKQLYYLNSAETKSHVAYFVKELRNDNIGRSLISESRKVSDAMVKIDINGDQWNYGGNHTVNYSLNYPIEHRQLKLSRILLFKKNSSPNINTAYGSTSQSHFDSYLYFNRNTNLTGGGNQNESDELRKAGCHYYNNVLIEKDIRHLNSKIRESILKEIVFNSDYSLASNFSGSTLLSGSTHLGKLTLNSVKIRGEYQSEIMPSYKFYYENPNYPYNNIFKDDWGSVVGLSINYIKQLANKDINFSFIDKSLASTWSLNRIIEPSGVEYEVQLESDAYEREAAFKYSEYAIEYFRIISSTQIEVKFVGNPSIEAFQENFNSNAPFTFYINLNEIKLGGTLKLDFPEKLFTCKLISKTNGIFLFEELSGTKINEMQSSFGPFQILNGGSNTDPIYPSSECSAFALGNAFGPMIGGGIRVKKIKTTDTKTNESSTIEYDYTKNGKTTGMTTYAPREIKRVIPFVNDIPGPQVYYAQVTSLYKGSDKNGPGGLLKKLIHNFEVPKLYTQSNGFGKYELKPCLKIERIKSITSNIWEGKFYPNTNPPVQILNSYNHVAYLISSFPATLGRPTSIFEYNYRGELVSQSIYSYSDIYSSGNYQEGFRFLKNTGKIQETFNQSKFYVIHHDFYSQSNYQEFTNKSFVTKAIGASVLTEVASSHFGDFNYSKLNDYDLFNGQPRKVESHGSQDEPIIRVSHFAHEIKHGSNDLNPLLQSKLYETNSNKKYNMLNAPGKEEVYLGNSLLGASAIKYSSNLNVRQFNSSSGKFETAS